MKNIVNEFGILEYEDKNNLYYSADNISIYKILEFLETKKDEYFNKIEIQYIYKAADINSFDDSECTIFDRIDPEISGIFENYEKLAEHINQYDVYFLECNIKFQYIIDYNGYAKDTVEIKCIYDDDLN